MRKITVQLNHVELAMLRVAIGTKVNDLMDCRGESALIEEYQRLRQKLYNTAVCSGVPVPDSADVPLLNPLLTPPFSDGTPATVNEEVTIKGKRP